MCVAASLSLNESCRVGSIISAFSRGWKSKAVDEVIKTSDQHTSVGTIGIWYFGHPKPLLLPRKITKITSLYYIYVDTRICKGLFYVLLVILVIL
jgi:hypothetical protein